jgi:RNA-directed DNA polymerase
MEGKHFHPTTIGVSQGAILRSLLANVYLHELNHFMEKYTKLSAYQRARRRQQGKRDFIYARYADSSYCALEPEQKRKQ